MNYTQHYQLPQWVDSDRILRTDFNDAYSKLDAALKSNADALLENAAAVSAKGNCQIVYGTYTGTGGVGSGSPNTLTFAHRPVFVAIRRQDSAGNNDTITTILVRGSWYCFPIPENINVEDKVTWGDTSVSWYASLGNSAQQSNSYGTVYGYVALLQVTE